jgi:hypothetical protein
MACVAHCHPQVIQTSFAQYQKPTKKPRSSINAGTTILCILGGGDALLQSNGGLCGTAIGYS